MTSPLRRKRPITPSNTAAAKGRKAWTKLVAGAGLALLLTTGVQAAERKSSVLKIRTVESSTPVPAKPAAARPKARASEATKLKTLAHAPKLSPTPAPPMFEEEFDSSVDQVAYEQYELISQEQDPEPLERSAPLLNSNGPSTRRSCDIKINRSIHDLTDATKATPGRMPEECAAPHGGPFEPRTWEETTFMWKASGLCHKPLYFEDVELERYGHSWGPVVQPVISGGKFFATVPVLPYKMGVEAPWECVYPLGYYRPGDCAPYMIPPVPVSVRGAAAQAAATVGGILLIP